MNNEHEWMKKILSDLKSQFDTSKQFISDKLEEEEEVSSQTINKIEEVINDLLDYVEGAVCDPYVTAILELNESQEEVKKNIIEILEEF